MPELLFETPSPRALGVGRADVQLMAEDDFPLGSAFVAKSRLFCLRRTPGSAQLLEWVDAGSPPRVWAGGRALPLVQTSSLVGGVVYAFSEEALYRLTADDVQIVWQSPTAITGMWVGPEGDRIAVTLGYEGARPGVVFLHSECTFRPVQRGGECLALTWLSTGDLAVADLVSRGSQQRTRIRVLSKKDLRPQMEWWTPRQIVALTGLPDANVAIGCRGVFTGSNDVEPSPGLWAGTLAADAPAMAFVSDRSPAHAICAFGENFVFVDGQDVGQLPLVVWVGPRGTVGIRSPYWFGEFAVWPEKRSIVFGEGGAEHGRVYSLTVPDR